MLRGMAVNKAAERQKVTRKIKQTQKRLESTESKEKKKISAELQELRVDLNYILVCTAHLFFSSIECLRPANTALP